MIRTKAKYASRILLASAGALAFQVSAHAQGVTDAPVAQDEEIVVTARQRAESVQDVPIAVSVLTARDIEEAGISQISDYAQLVPNVSYDNSLNLGQNFLTIRGMTQVQFAPPPVAIVVDGVLQISPYQFNVDGLDLSQIEVLKGPQGAIYGRNAIGGAINITTRRPTNDFEGSVRAGYATGEEISAQAAISGPIVDDRLLFSASLSATDREGGQIVNATTGRPVDHYEDQSARARLLFMPSADWEIDVSYRYADTQGPDPAFTLTPRNDPNDTSLPPISNTIGSNHRELHDIAGRVSWHTPLGAAALSLGYVDVYEELRSDFDFLDLDILNVLQSYDNQGFSQELRFTSNEDARFRWIIGAYHVTLKNQVGTIGYEDLDSDGAADDASVHMIDANETENYAVFGQIAYDVTPALELTLAARYDHDDHRQVTTVVDPPFGDFPTAASFDELQPKITARYSISDDFNIYASWGRGFRNGGFNSIFASTRVFRPEVAETFEVGLKARTPDRRFNIDLAAFSTELTDAQFLYLNYATLTNETTNINEVEITGFEAALSFRVTDNLTLAAGLGVTDTEIGNYTPDPTANGNQVPKAPPYTFNLSATYNWSITDRFAGSVRMDYQRQGEIYWDILNDLRREPLDLLNLRISIGTDGPGPFAALWGRNLLDERLPTEYIPVEQSDHPTGLDAYQRNRGALYGVEIGYRF